MPDPGINPTSPSSNTNPFTPSYEDSNEVTKSKQASASTPLDEEKKQQLALVYVLLLSLLDSMVVSSQGMIARSKDGENINILMQKLQNMFAQQHKLKHVESPKEMQVPTHRGGRWTWKITKMAPNKDAVTHEVQYNRTVVQDQLLQSLQMGALQQDSEIFASMGSTAMEALGMVVKQLTQSIADLKNLSALANLTKPKE